MDTRHKFTKRIAWTGRIWIALLCAFFALSMMSVGLAADANGAGMTLERYEQLFGFNPVSPESATLDFDGDGLSNWEEAYKGTNPFRADSDEDGWLDAADNEISRALLTFYPLFTNGNSLRYLWPSFMVSVFKSGGEWEPSLPA